MPQDPRRARPPWVLGILEVAGAALILELLFVAFAWPLVTAFPAAVALQRQLPDLTVGGRPRAGLDFWRDVVRTVRQAWLLSLGLPVVFGAAVLAVLFWAATGGGVALLALTVMAPLLGLAAAGYLALLQTAAEQPEQTWTHWCRSVPARVADAPLRAAGTVVVLLTCVLLLVRLPTLVVVLAGLVPALLARWAFSPDAGQASGPAG